MDAMKLNIKRMRLNEEAQKKAAEIMEKQKYMPEPEPALRKALTSAIKGRFPVDRKGTTLEQLMALMKEHEHERYYFEHQAVAMMYETEKDEDEEEEDTPEEEFVPWCIPFYDFDATVEKELTPADVNGIITAVLRGLRTVHGHTAEYRVARACGYNPEKKKFMFSLHVYVHGVGKYDRPMTFMAHCVPQASKAVSAELVAKYYYLETDGKPMLDVGIYKNTDSALRTIYSFKRDQEHRPMIPLDDELDEIPFESITPETFARYFFTTLLEPGDTVYRSAAPLPSYGEAKQATETNDPDVKHALALLQTAQPAIYAAVNFENATVNADGTIMLTFNRKHFDEVHCPICNRGHDGVDICFLYMMIFHERVAMFCRRDLKPKGKCRPIFLGDSLKAIEGQDACESDDDISFYAAGDEKSPEEILAANVRIDALHPELSRADNVGDDIQDDTPIVIDSAETKALNDVLTELQRQRTALEDELKRTGSDCKTAKELKQRERLVTKIAKLTEKESKQREKIATKIAKLTEKEQKARDKRAKQNQKAAAQAVLEAKARWQPDSDAPLEIREIWHATRHAMGDLGLAELYRKYYGGDLVMGDIKTVFLFNREKKIWQNYNVGSCITSCHLRDIIVPIIEKCQTHATYTEYMQKTYDDTLNKLRKTKPAADIFSQTMSHFIDPLFETRDYDNHHLFPIADGKVINFKTGQIEERLREHMLIYTSNVRYISKDDATYSEGMNAVHEFIKNVTGEFSGSTLPGDRSTLTRFMQDMLGYLLTGGVLPKLYFIWNGEKGNNGKSILDNVMSKILDGYHRTATKRAFIAKKQPTAHDADLTPLLTGRMIVMNELSKNQEFDQETIKQWSGFDGVAARECNQAGKDALPVKPRGKIVMKTNTIPEWKQTGSDDADFRAFVDRMCVIPFDVEFVNEVQNPGCQRRKNTQLVTDIEGKYLSHFFTWICEGAMRYFAKNETIDIPEIVRNKKDAVIRSKDIFRDFLDETIELVNDDDKKVYVDTLWTRYKSFMQGSQPMSAIAFGKQMKKLYENRHVHTNQGNAYKGMKLKFEDPAPASAERPIMMELV